MDRDRYFVERCKNLPRKQRQTIIHLRCSNLRFKVQNEDLTLGIQSTNLLRKQRQMIIHLRCSNLRF